MTFLVVQGVSMYFRVCPTFYTHGSSAI
jgi:hypothetical protein